MKIKKSELLALIKEEIMNEMDGLTMMDDPRDAGLAFPDQSALERMIAGDDGMMQEGVDAESMQVVADVAQKMAPLIGVMSLPVLIGLIYEKLKEMGAK
jgi:hypothetical protein